MVIDRNERILALTAIDPENEIASLEETINNVYDDKERLVQFFERWLAARTVGFLVITEKMAYNVIDIQREGDQHSGKATKVALIMKWYREDGSSVLMPLTWVVEPDVDVVYIVLELYK